MPNKLVQKKTVWIQFSSILLLRNGIMRTKSSRITKSFSVGAQWSKEKLGIAKPSTFDSDFLITEKTYRALEQLLRDLIRYIVIYLQPKSK